MKTKTLDLTGSWQFMEYPTAARRMRDIDEKNWLDCSVPSSIFTNLIDAKKIDRFDVLANPENYQYVSKKPWLYKKTFDCPEDMLGFDRCELVFDGLDTVSQIWLNGKLIAKTKNMFTQHRFEVKELLRAGENSLIVKFDSSIEYSENLQRRYGTIIDDPNSFSSRVYLRKAQCQFGWDWAPAMPGCGIFRPVRIIGIEKAKIANLHIRTIDCSREFADVRVSVELDKAVAEDYRCKVKIFDDEQRQQSCHEIEFHRRDDYQSAVFRIDAPSLWWPRGYGRQPIYSLKAELLYEEEVVDSRCEHFGIRTVKVNQQRDSFGKSFQFEINGVPVYCKGANWVPASIFFGVAQEAEYLKLITAAANANMNMLRVWGGGCYEESVFYETCDRLGIMVWQDFMFACGYYPDRAWFCEEVEKEAQQIIKRLRNHPSLVLWCGNNEIHWLHKEIWRRKKFYGKAIYNKVLPKLIAELDPDRDYINSAPFGPEKNPNNHSEGTVHNWTVWSGLKPTDSYLTAKSQTPRFVDEFGFQSMPSQKTLETFVPAEELKLGSAALEKHDYQQNGIERLNYYIAENFAVPRQIDDFVYLSQVTQARAAAKYVYHLRANSEINSGALFWQLNDACAAVSWSCLDYLGEPKALYYYSRRFFADTVVAVLPEFEPRREGRPGRLSKLSAVVSNQSALVVTGMLTCRVMDFGFNVVDEFSRPFSISPGDSANVNLPKSFIVPTRPDSSYVHLEFKNNTQTLAENSYFYLPDKYFCETAPKLRYELKDTRPGICEIILSPNSLIRDLQIDPGCEAVLSENFFDLLSPAKRSITIETKEAAKDLSAMLKLQLRFKCTNPGLTAELQSEL